VEKQRWTRRRENKK